MRRRHVRTPSTPRKTEKSEESAAARRPADRPLGVRLSVEDHLPGGWDTEQSIALIRRLEAMGVSYVCASSGGLSLAQRVTVFEGYQVGYARALRKACGVPVMTVGMIESPAHANRIVTDGDADLVALARAFLQDPHWPWRAAAELDADIPFPREYIRAYRSRWHRAARRGGAAGRREVKPRTATPFGSEGPGAGN